LCLSFCFCDTGQAGSVGNTGVQGSTGETGIRGVTGDTGSPGATGSRGVIYDQHTELRSSLANVL